MGLFKGNDVELDIEEMSDELAFILVAGEVIRRAYQLKDDVVVLTDKRILRTDKQGAKANRLEYSTIPYRSVHYFRKEITGRNESELIIYLTGIEEPLRLKFKHDNILSDAYQVLSKCVLR